MPPEVSIREADRALGESWNGAPARRSVASTSNSPRPIPNSAYATSWWWRAAVLGSLNIGLFFALLFIAAYRLPGGVAAVLGALAPFVVAAFAFALLGERPARRALVAGAIGVAGVALLVLRSTVVLDPIGLAAAAGGMVTMSLGTVLGRRWGIPDGFGHRTTALLALTGWQLTVGGLLLLPVAFVIEGAPPTFTVVNLAGLGYLSIAGTALAYFLWFRGVTALAPTRVTLLALLSPVVAAALGWVVLGQGLSAGQLLGAAAVLGAVLLGASPQPLKAPVRSNMTSRTTSSASSPGELGPNRA